MNYVLCVVRMYTLFQTVYVSK